MDRPSTASDKQEGTSGAEPSQRSAGTLQRRRLQLHWPPERDFRILAIDGGGIRGILPAAVLSELETQYLGGQSIGRYFDLIVGTSTGGIISLGLGSGMTARELRDLYLTRGQEIFPPAKHFRTVTRSLRGLLMPRFEQAALRKVLTDTLGNRILGDSTNRLCIPSCDGRYGDVYIFKTAHHPDYKKDWREAMIDIAIATAAAPTYFKPYAKGGYRFVDGGLWANNPVMIGLVDALACFDVDRHRIRILSLGCVPGQFHVNWLKQNLGGLIAWRDAVFGSMDLQSLNVDGQAGLLIGRERLVRIDADPISPAIDLDNFARARDELPPLALQLVAKFGEQVREHFLKTPVVPYDRFQPAPA
ncbi:unnamed protein product [Phaeothamnion confervicola]